MEFFHGGFRELSFFLLFENTVHNVYFVLGYWYVTFCEEYDRRTDGWLWLHQQLKKNFNAALHNDDNVEYVGHNKNWAKNILSLFLVWTTDDDMLLLLMPLLFIFCDKEGSQPSNVASSSTKSSRWRHHTVAKGIMQLLCCCNSCNGQQPKRRITAATMASCRHRLLAVWLDFNSAADVDGGMWFWRYCVGHNLIIFITLMLLLCAQPNSAPTSYQRNH